MNTALSKQSRDGVFSLMVLIHYHIEISTFIASRLRIRKVDQVAYHLVQLIGRLNTTNTAI